MFLVYLTLGAYMFYSIERPLEEERRAVAKAEALQIKGDVSSRVKKTKHGNKPKQILHENILNLDKVSVLNFIKQPTIDR